MPELNDHLQQIVDIVDSSKLMEDLAILVIQLEDEIKTIIEMAEEHGVPPNKLINGMTDEPYLRPILIAKAHAYNAITALKSTEQYARTQVFNQYMHGAIPHDQVKDILEKTI